MRDGSLTATLTPVFIEHFGIADIDLRGPGRDDPDGLGLVFGFEGFDWRDAETVELPSPKGPVVLLWEILSQTIIITPNIETLHSTM